MPANQYGVDIAGMFKDVEAVKGARMNNKLGQLSLDAAETTAAKNKMATGLRQQVIGGDEDAKTKLIALDPEGGASFIGALSKMDDQKREAVQRTVDEIGKLSATVLQAAPEKQALLYAQMRSMVSPEVAAGMPEEFSPQFMELSLSKATTIDQILGNPTAVNMGDKGEMWKGGRKVSEYSTGKAEDRQGRINAAAIKAKGKGSGAGNLKSADESLMYRQSAELLGGIFDQQGNITNLDPEARNRVQAIATEAANIFAAEGSITRSEAVKRAAKAYGLNVKDVPGGDPSDPNNIRNFMSNQ